MINSGNKKQNIATNFPSQDGGFLYTFIIVSVLFVSIIFSAILSVVLASNPNFIGEDVYIIISYFLGPVALFFAIGVLRYKTKKPIIKPIFAKKIDKKALIATVFIALGLMFGLSELNVIFVDLLKSINLTVKEPSLPTNSTINIILIIVSACVLPAILEEVAFRGIILNSLSRTGVVFAVIISGVLFSLFHMSPAQTIYQFLVGAIYSLIVIYGGNVIFVIIAHFINNLYVVLNYYYFNFTLQGGPLIAITILGVISLLFGIFILVYNRKPINVAPEERKQNRLNFLLCALIGLVATIVIWLQGLING